MNIDPKRKDKVMKKDVDGIDLDVIEAEENLVIDAQFLIQDIMNRKGLSRAEVARKAGISKARLSQLMGPAANPTVKTIARVLHAMGERISLAAPLPAEPEPTAEKPRTGWEDLVSAGGPRRTPSRFDDESLRAFSRIREIAGSNDNHLRARTLRELRAA